MHTKKLKQISAYVLLFNFNKIPPFKKGGGIALKQNRTLMSIYAGQCWFVR